MAETDSSGSSPGVQAPIDAGDARHQRNVLAARATMQFSCRVAEARVEDIGHAVARLSPGDLVRIGAQPGDVLKITGATTAVAKAALAEPDLDGHIQIDGTARSNC